MAALALGGPAASQSLKQTFAAAYKNSNLLDQNRALLRATDESAAVAMAALRPVVTFAGTATATEPAGLSGDRLTTNLSLSAQLTLYDGGDSSRRSRRGSLAELAKSAEKKGREGMRSDVTNASAVGGWG